MIILNLKGGLGNQLFQYAAARHLALVKNVPLKLDCWSSYKNDPFHRSYKLSYFNIIENFISEDEISNLLAKGEFFRKIIRFVSRKVKSRILIYIISQINTCFKLQYYVEKSLNYNEQLIRLKNKGIIYLDGYWGSEKYFHDIENIIREELTVKNVPDEQNQTMINEILAVESISLHVRRGDYISHPDASKVFGMCSMEYYDAAIKKLSEKIENPHFFIFSDDQEWVQKNLILPFPTTYVTLNGSEKDYEDLRLMSLCKHNIIANSTFSWWGAWLNSNPHKTVIAPKIWFRDPLINAKVKFEDLYPAGWVIL